MRQAAIVILSMKGEEKEIVEEIGEILTEE